MAIEYAIIIKNKTRLEVLTERFNTRAQARFYIESLGGDFKDYELEHEQFHDSLSLVQRSLSGVLKNKLVERSFLPSFIFSNNQVVLVIGQDGLVANAAKYVQDAPIIAINPDKGRYDGVLLPFGPGDFLGGVEKLLKNQYQVHTASFAEAKLNDGQRLLAFNDLFIGAATHVSARYRISFLGKTEEHSSSGIIVSTKAGSTGWMSSIFNMAHGMHNFVEEEDSKLKYIGFHENELMFAVREPFASRRTQTSIQAGILGGRMRLQVESLMPSYGVIFSDGVESDFMRFNSGSVANIGIAKEKVNLVQP